jgi:hypothetical protein
LVRLKKVQRDINGKKRWGVEYIVVTPEGHEKTITFSLAWVRTIQELLRAGHTNIRVSRRGSRLDTNYTFMPV